MTSIGRFRSGICACALAAGLVLACGPGGGATDGRTSSSPQAATDRVRWEDAPRPRYGIRLSTDQAVYAPGDTIRMRLEVFHRHGEPLTLSFPTAQRHDFVLRGPGTAGSAAVRWRWSEGRFFAQATGTETLDDRRPALTASAAHPAPADPGLYRLEGRLSAADWPISAVVPLTVTP